MGEPRPSYLRRITRRDGGGLPILGPPNPLLRRWEMTAPAWRAPEPQTAASQDVHITTAVSPLPSLASAFNRPRHDSQIEPTSTVTLKEPVGNAEPAARKEEAAAPGNAPESLPQGPSVRAGRSVPEMKNPPPEPGEAQITDGQNVPEDPVPAGKRAWARPQRQRTAEAPPPSEALPLPTIEVAPASPARRTAGVSSSHPTSKPATENPPVVFSPPKSPVAAHEAQVSRPLPPAIRTRLDATPTTHAPSVHIGSVEIRILPPAPPLTQPPRAAAISSSSSSLSRGFTSSFGLKQG
jgi:hypothetical protein